MDLDSLRLFLRITQFRTLAAASAELHLSTAALSRSIKRLEQSLRMPLFDRSGKVLVLNDAGNRLREQAVQIFDMVDAIAAQFEGAAFKVHCRVAAPAVLQWEWGLRFATALEAAQAGNSLSFRTLYEDECLETLARGDVDFAIVTQGALQSGPAQHLTSGFGALELSTIEMQLAASALHPMMQGRKKTSLPTALTKEVLTHDFAAPSRSMFCGVGRGAQSDGWRDDQLPRRIRYWIDDLQQLVDFVASGRALAYLPSFVIDRAKLQRISVSDCAYQCKECSVLVWRQTAVSGWQKRLLDCLTAKLA
jgi:DNA-binding transcriptional LysR family regulator